MVEISLREDGGSTETPIPVRRTPRRPVASWVGTNVSFHPLGIRGILFNAASQNFFLVDRTSAFLWCRLAEGAPPETIVAELASRSGAPTDAARLYLDRTLAGWLATGVLANQLKIERHPLANPAVGNTPGALLRRRPRKPDARRYSCRVLDSTIDIRFADSALEAAGLALMGVHSTAPTNQPDETIEVARDGGGVTLRRAGRVMLAVPRGHSLAPAVLAALIRIALARSATFPALHAASMRTSEGGILFPGPSGCGKSTLAAALWAAGKDVAGDDTVVLDGASLRVRPVTPQLCVKSGSWRELEPRIPSLASARVYRRPDGKRARYLALTPHVMEPAESSFSVRAIVFPSFGKEGKRARCYRLRPVQALWRLLPCIDPIGHRLTAADVDRLIRWVADTPCYALKYASTDAALRSLEELVK